MIFFFSQKFYNSNTCVEIHRKCKYSHAHPNINTLYTVAAIYPGPEIDDKLPTSSKHVFLK